MTITFSFQLKLQDSTTIIDILKKHNHLTDDVAKGEHIFRIAGSKTKIANEDQSLDSEVNVSIFRHALFIATRVIDSFALLIV